MNFTYNNSTYPVKVTKKNNKNTYLRYTNGTINVTCPPYVTTREIEKIIKNNEKTIIKWIEKEAQTTPEDGTITIFGKKYEVVIEKFHKFSIESHKIYTSSEKELTKYLDNYLKITFQNHLDYWYNKYEEKIPIPNLKIRKMKSRWGVCNIKNNNVTLNSELIKYDIECLDYVIIHELSHFIHFNHSKEFWAQVAKYCSNYKKIRQNLRN